MRPPPRPRSRVAGGIREVGRVDLIEIIGQVHRPSMTFFYDVWGWVQGTIESPRKFAVVLTVY